MAKDEKILFEIKEHIGTISSNTNGWDKEINIVSWNGQKTPKFDIRAWNEDHTHMARGITLFSDEMSALVDLYCEWKKEREKKGIDGAPTPEVSGKTANESVEVFDTAAAVL